MMEKPRRESPNPETSFLASIEEMEKNHATFQRRNLEQINRFFQDPPPNVTDKQREVMKSKLLKAQPKFRDDPFAAFMNSDTPEMNSVVCGSILSCGHPCQQPLNSGCHNCGETWICTAPKPVIRPCGHLSHTYCGREELETPCSNMCHKETKCGHSCRETCHYPRSCQISCQDFYCKVIYDKGNEYRERK